MALPNINLTVAADINASVEQLKKDINSKIAPALENQLKVSIALDTTKLQAQLDKSIDDVSKRSYTANFDIKLPDVGKIQDQIKSMTQSTGKIEVPVNIDINSKSLTEFTQTIAEAQRQVGNFDVAKISTDSKSASGKLSEFTATINYFNKATKESRTDTLKFNESLRSLETVSSKATKNVKTYSEELGKIENIKINDNVLTKANTIVESLAASFKKVGTNLEETNSDFQRFVALINQASTTALTESQFNEFSKLNTEVGNLNKSIQEFANKRIYIDGEPALVEIEKIKASLAAMTNNGAAITSFKVDTTNMNNVVNLFDKINSDLQNGRLSLGQYNTKLVELKTTLATAKQEQASLNAALREVKAVNDQINALEQLNNRINIYLSDTSKMANNSQLINSFRTLQNAVQDAISSRNISQVNDLKAQFNSLQTQVRQVGSEANNAGNLINSAFGNLGIYFSLAAAVRKVINAFKDMNNQVRTIDTAMTELKRVSEGTESQYNSFMSSAVAASKEIGAAIDDYINAAADFSRLGYSMEDAAELATIANVYKNVGYGIDNINDASQSIISTMKAFGIEAEGAMDIVDKFNKVGNEFAVSSGGIGEALRRSASSLAATNNTLEESIGLVVAANATIQDEVRVGTALKTLSMRLTNTAGQLEELGEDAEGAAESITQLQTQILNLTSGKVNIMLDSTTFKSTYQIVSELADVWQDLDNVTQQTLTRLVAGKNQGAIFNSMMINMKDGVDATTVALNSQGSALKENEIRLDSIQGKIEQFENSWQALSLTVVSSELVKTFYDIRIAATDAFNAILQNGFSRMLVTIPLIIVSLSSLQVILSNIAKTKLFNDLVSSMKAFTAPIAAAIASFRALFVEQLRVQASQQGLTVSSGSLSVAQTLLTAKNVGLTASFKALATATQAWVAANPVGAILLIGTAVIGLASAIKNLVDEQYNRWIEKQNEIIDNAKKEIDSYQVEIDRLNALSDKLEQAKDNKESLAQVASELNDITGISVKLTDDEAASYEKLNKILQSRVSAAQELQDIETKRLQQASLEKYENYRYQSDTALFGGIFGEKKTTGEELQEISKEINRLMDAGLEFDDAAQKAIDSISSWHVFGNISVDDYNKSIAELTTYIEDIYSDIINSDAGNILGQDFLGKFINEAVLAGRTPQEIGQDVNYILELIEGITEQEEKWYGEHETILNGMIDLTAAATAGITLMSTELGYGSDLLSERLKIWYNNLVPVNDEIDNTINLLQQQEEMALETTNSIDVLNKAIYEQMTTGKLSNDTYKNLVSVNEDYNKLVDVQDGKIVLLIKDAKTLTKELANTATKELTLAGASEELIKSINNIVDSYETFLNTLDEAETRIGILEKAEKELSGTGQLTASTLRSIIDNDLLQYLEIVDGQLVVTEGSLEAMGESAKIAAIGQLQSAAAADILHYANGEVEKMSGLAKSAIAAMGNAAQGSVAQFNSASQASSFLAANLSALASVIGLNPKVNTEGIDAITSAYTKAADAISNINIGGATAKSSGGGGSKGSSGGGTSTTETLKNQFEEELKLLQYYRDAMLISEEEYFNRLRALNDKYFKDQEEYLDEYRKYELEVSKGLMQIEENRLSQRLSLAQDTRNFDEQLRIQKEYQDRYHAQAEHFRELGFKETDIEIMELQEKWRSHGKELINILGETYSEARDEIERNIDKIDYQISLIDVQDYDTRDTALSKYREQMDLLINKENELLRQQNKVIEQMNHLEVTTDNNVKLTQNYKDLMESLESVYENNAKALIELANAQQEVIIARRSYAESELSLVEEYQDTIVNLIKSRYEKEKDLLKQKLDDDNDALDKEKDRLKDRYDAELAYIDERLAALQKVWDEEDKRKKQADDEADIADLQRRINELRKAAATGDVEAISRIEDLQKQLNEKLKKQEEDEVDDERQKIKDEYADEKERLQNLYNLQLAELEKRQQLLEDEYNDRLKKLEDQMSNENLYAQAREEILKEEYSNIIDWMQEYEKEFGKGAGILGDYINNNITKQVESAREALGDVGTELQNMYENIALLKEDMPIIQAAGLEDLGFLTSEQRDVIEKMKENAKAWSEATTEANKRLLEIENEQLGYQQGFYKENGVWYLDETKTATVFDLIEEIKDKQISNINDVGERYQEDYEDYVALQESKSEAVSDFSTNTQNLTDQIYQHAYDTLQTYDNDFSTSTLKISGYIESLTERINNAISRMNSLISLANSISNVEIQLQVTQPTYSASGGISGYSTNIERFAVGGVPVITSPNSGGLAIVDKKERVLTQKQNVLFEKLIDAMTDKNTLANHMIDSSANLSNVPVSSNAPISISSNIEVGSVTQDSMGDFSMLLERHQMKIAELVSQVSMNGFRNMGGQIIV